jgi:hypothetical protein
LTPLVITNLNVFARCDSLSYFLLVHAENKIVCIGMITDQKTAAIRSILTNHEDNLAARKAANVPSGLEAIVIEAMNTALKADLVLIFASRTVTSGSD